jgi:hypothetical protein
MGVNRARLLEPARD